MGEIEKRDDKEREEREKVKSMGGRRIQIVDTDGSENEEDYEEKAIKIADVDETKTRPSKETANNTSQIKIAQVESEEEDLSSSSTSPSSENDEDKDKDYGGSPSSSKGDESVEKVDQVAEVIHTPTPTPAPIPKKEESQFELEPRLTDEKDRANRAYKNGQYGDAIVHFTRVIDELEKHTESKPGKDKIN